MGDQACRVAWVKLVCDSHPGKSQERERCGGRGVTCCDKSYRGLNLRPVDSWHTSSAMGAQDWRSVVFLGSVSSGFPIIPKTDGNQTVHVTSFEDPEKHRLGFPATESKLGRQREGEKESGVGINAAGALVLPGALCDIQRPPQIPPGCCRHGWSVPS